VSDHARGERERQKKRKQAANMQANGHVWCHTERKKNKLQTCMQVGTCGVRLCTGGEREREEHKSVGVGTCMERENEKNIGAHACMHMGSNQKNYSGTEPSKRYWAE